MSDRFFERIIAGFLALHLALLKGTGDVPTHGPVYAALYVAVALVFFIPLARPRP